MSNRVRITRFLLRWHRRFGILLALFIIALSLTGLALNHSRELGLDRAHVSNHWLLDWYGLEQPTISAAYAAGPYWLIEIEGRLYLNEQPLRMGADLHGALLHRNLLIVALEDALILLTPDGAVVETINAGLPTPIIALGLDANGHATINTADGPFRADRELLNWTAPAAMPAQWSTAGRPPATLTQTVLEAHRQHMLSWEHLLLELHSGRLFGLSGRLVLDLIGVALILLALSGMLLWQRIHPPRSPKS